MRKPDHDQERKTEQLTENKLSQAMDRGQLAKSHAASFVDHRKQTQPALVAELRANLVTLGIIRQVSQNLLCENVAILMRPAVPAAVAKNK